MSLAAEIISESQNENWLFMLMSTADKISGTEIFATEMFSENIFTISFAFSLSHNNFFVTTL